MSNLVAYTRMMKDFPCPSGEYWYVLKDKRGKVRDWTPADNAKCARAMFKLWRDNERLPNGCTVERRGKVMP